MPSSLHYCAWAPALPASAEQSGGGDLSTQASFEEIVAAIVIQACWRGFAVRKIYSPKLGGSNSEEVAVQIDDAILDAELLAELQALDAGNAELELGGYEDMLPRTRSAEERELQQALALSAALVDVLVRQASGGEDTTLCKICYGNVPLAEWLAQQAIRCYCL